MRFSEGAKKAWETIRANKAHEKRSKAAKKANKTRGPEGRHQAAVKAWKTRKNGNSN